MAAPARATLLFSREHRAVEEDDDDDVRSLDSIGAKAVLGAMVEQRKRSSSLPPPPPEESGERPRVDKKSLGFIKLR